MEQEVPEELVVVVADAVADPGAVVVHAEDADATYFTVVAAWRAQRLA